MTVLTAKAELLAVIFFVKTQVTNGIFLSTRPGTKRLLRGAFFFRHLSHPPDTPKKHIEKRNRM